jgi:hypothetical protein
VKSWKRRYFIFDEGCVLRYYNKEPSDKSSKLKGSLQITSFSDNIGSLQCKIPKQYDPENAIVFTTTHPGKQIFLVVAESVDEKHHWMTGMETCFQPERSLDISTILSSQTDYYGNIFDIDDILQESGDNSSSISFPAAAQRRIACFIGNIRDIIRLSTVSKSWNQSLRYKSQSRMWLWLVRHGTLHDRQRWKFWCHVMTASEAADREAFNRLIREASVFNKYEIEKDVNRAFGVSMSKRVTERRSILPPHMSDASALDDVPMKYRLSLGGMQSIHEDSDNASLSPESDCDSSCDGSAVLDEGDWDGGDGVRKAWGRGGRSTMPWPETPNDEDTKKVTTRRGRNRQKSPQKKKVRGIASRGDSGDCELPGAKPGSQSPPKTPPRSPTSSQSPPRTPSSPPPALTNEDIQRKKLSLTRILQALSTRFETVGYCQGLDRIVVHCMRSARCAVSSRSCPNCDLDRRDEIDEKRERECFAFLEKLFIDLSLTGADYRLHCLCY